MMKLWWFISTYWTKKNKKTNLFGKETNSVHAGLAWLTIMYFSKKKKRNLDRLHIIKLSMYTVNSKYFGKWPDIWKNENTVVKQST